MRQCFRYAFGSVTPRGFGVLLAVAIPALAALLAMATPAWAGEPTTVNGRVGYISADAVEVAGRRGIFSGGSDIRSDHHPVSWSSIQVGMPASLELDDAGRVLELRVSGVVE